jgi:hypothetical protein
VTKRFIRVRRVASLGQFRLHDLRHFMATEMLDTGVPVPIVAARSPMHGPRRHSTCTPTPCRAEIDLPQRRYGEGSSELGAKFERVLERTDGD